LYQARQRFREANQGRDTLPNQGYQAQQTAEHLKPAFLRTDAPNWHAQNANGGRLSRVNAEKGHFFDRAALANGCADLGGGGGVFHAVFHGLQDACIAASQFFTKKEFAIEKVFMLP
jgi:hypothetical protein